MNNIRRYIAERNLWRKFADRPWIDVDNLTQQNVNDLAMSLDSEMSPENLHCDGEISAAQARKKARAIKGAFYELTLLATTAGFTMPETYELY
jgi:hypothetical protein